MRCSGCTAKPQNRSAPTAKRFHLRARESSPCRFGGCSVRIFNRNAGKNTSQNEGKCVIPPRCPSLRSEDWRHKVKSPDEIYNGHGPNIFCQNGHDDGVCVVPSSLHRAPCARLCLSHPGLSTMTPPGSSRVINSTRQFDIGVTTIKFPVISNVNFPIMNKLHRPETKHRLLTVQNRAPQRCEHQQQEGRAGIRPLLLQ